MSEDLISREALKKDIEENAIELGGVLAIEVDCAKALIDIAPTVEPYTGEECLNIKMTKEEMEQFKQMLQEHTHLYTVTSDTFVEGASDKRPTGEWIIIGEEQGALGIIYKIKKCPKCGWEHSLVIPDNFCPNCGAYMMRGGRG